MAAGDWNFLAARILGDGTFDVIETELPIQMGPMDRNLSAPSSMSGTISNEVQRYRVNNQLIFQPKSTLIIAEAGDQIRGMGIYMKPQWTGEVWTLDCMGLSGYPIGQPYHGEAEFLAADPLDMFRNIWSNLQGQPYGNLGITIDPLKSPVRVGIPSQQLDPTTADPTMLTLPDQPRRYNWYSTFDLGKEVDDLAKETPFDWLELNSWQGEQPHCHLQLGYPIMGGTKDQYRLVYGENVLTEPKVSAADFVNSYYFLGAGEGRDRIRGYAGVSDGRLRWTKVVEDKKVETTAKATDRARELLAQTRGELFIDQVDIIDHPNAPLESIEMGDELELYCDLPWNEVDEWVRIVGRSETPESGVLTLTVVRKGVV